MVLNCQNYKYHRNIKYLISRKLHLIFHFILV